jgi:hypothetical protein
MASHHTGQTATVPATKGPPGQPAVCKVPGIMKRNAKPPFQMTTGSL